VNPSYEVLLALVDSLRKASSAQERHISWCTSGKTVGFARNHSGHIELFLQGGTLTARLQRVRAALEYERWYRSDGEELLANRILLPAAGHFEQIAAFLATELIRNGADEDLSTAFERSEPLIELAIEDLYLADSSLLGLCGELVVLLALVRAAPEARLAEVFGSWKGFRETSRDFQLGAVGLEVKTTSLLTSSHRFTGVRQLEPGHGVDGVEERHYILASIGLEWSDSRDETVSTLPEVLDDLGSSARAALGPSASEVIDALRVHVSDYGSSPSAGYLHGATDAARFHRPFRVAFARGYDMADSAIALLTSTDLQARPFIDEASLALRITFPPQVRGDLNPVVGLSAMASRIIDLAWLGGGASAALRRGRGGRSPSRANYAAIGTRSMLGIESSRLWTTE
jgi:hypothetical protein